MSNYIDIIKANPAAAAIEFALKTEEGIEFLRCWNEGDFDSVRSEWPDAPETVFVGADGLHPGTRVSKGVIMKPHNEGLSLLIVDGAKIFSGTSKHPADFVVIADNEEDARKQAVQHFGPGQFTLSE